MSVPKKSLNEQCHNSRPRYPELTGQVALVTGASRGIGKGIAIRLALEGMKLVVSGLEQAETEAVATELQELGITVHAIWGDLSETSQIERLFHETVTTFGRLDLLVNNAASVARTSFFKADALLLERQLASNRQMC